jgi:uncharacterized caspase-like protein
VDAKHVKRVIFLLVAALMCCSAQAASAKRVALVVGNGDYASAGKLINPPRDAALVSGALKQAGFDVIQIQSNVSLAKFHQALRSFETAALGADVALVYYAGHGMEAKGQNWLIPIDASLSSERALPYEAVSLDLVLQAVSGAKVRLVFLDACRDNPFGRSWGASTRSVQRGLARIEVDDVLVVYAAAPGQTAADGSGGNSPFAQAVARRLPEPGVPIQLLGGLVRDDVLDATNNAQRPFVSASITGRPVYLVGGSPGSTPAAASPAQPGADAEVAFWNSIGSSVDPSDFEAYLRKYPQGVFADLARARAVRRTAEPAAAALADAGDPWAKFWGSWALVSGGCAGGAITFPKASPPTQFTGGGTYKLSVASPGVLTYKTFVGLKFYAHVDAGTLYLSSGPATTKGCSYRKLE